MADTAVTLTEASAREIMLAAGVSCSPRVALVHEHNHVYRIEAGDAVFYLKTFTKDWYSGEPAQMAGCVTHEASAYRILARHGLPTPRVAATDETCENPLGRPFILMEGLPGRPLMEALAAAAPGDFDAMLGAVGRYMARMHAITFRFPGYLMGDGPAAPPDPNAWRHFIWAADVFNKIAVETWETDSQLAGTGLLERARLFCDLSEDSLRAEYRPPRFTHGDCHAHQFFVSNMSGKWEVSGVVDMEVASAGDCGADFVKLGLELAGEFPNGANWWEPLFASYGKEPSFEPMKLRFAAMAYNAEYLGRYNWPGSRAPRLEHILDCRDWQSMFDLGRIGPGKTMMEKQ